MTRLIAFAANDPDRLRCLLHAGRRQLVAAAEGADGWGIGFYQVGEVLLQRRPKRPTQDVDFYQVASELRTDMLVGHVRRATVGGVKNENSHPFRFRSWLFAHLGTIPGFAAIEEPMRAEIPDFLRRNIRGQTDSEHLFHLFLGQLHEANRIDDPTLTPLLATAALSESLAILERLSAGASRSMGLAITNGRILLALRRGAPLYQYRTGGVRDCPVCREPAEFGREPKRIDHEHLRGVALIGGVDAPPPAPWEEVPDDHVLAVHHDLHTELFPTP